MKGKDDIQCLKSVNKDQNSVCKALEDSVGVLGESAKHAMMYELTIHAQVDFDTEPLSTKRLYDGLLNCTEKTPPMLSWSRSLPCSRRPARSSSFNCYS